MGSYCKAYPVRAFREFPDWKEELTNLRKQKKSVDGKETEVIRDLSDDSFFYLQENLVVTDSIMMDENVIFAADTPQWREFCGTTLKFEIPEYARPRATPDA
jgi:hypothetical protein